MSIGNDSKRLLFDFKDTFFGVIQLNFRFIFPPFHRTLKLIQNV